MLDEALCSNARTHGKPIAPRFVGEYCNALVFPVYRSARSMPPSDGPQPLGDVIQSVIDRLGLRSRINEARIIEAWATLAGPQVNGVTSSVWLKGNTLFVKIRSAAWRQELHLRRRDWCQRLNDELGEALVDEIVFR
jgi:predicted nucleic acid-binding Zn ribbon protein